ncbi:MAG: tRNA (adenosine(37)-N6)-threonylcarbamoyltransferase complex ATPase subunit type 1 TsaE [Gammaproteobacteria bacterium]|nr:tRNA (adenosine(37)-N6)-threonylcarbamoyltransferase complex ATPase subunit type 1 TsaE [Gammaproteobacteria bacterium]
MGEIGARLIAACDRGGVITLKGELGVGKTTLVRGALQSLGLTTGVRSPTYTLIELYRFEHINVAHFDLYRLADAEELEYLGYRDYLNPETLCFIEWPQRAGGYLQTFDLEVEIEYDPEGRRLGCFPGSEWGEKLLSRVNLMV